MRAYSESTQEALRAGGLLKDWAAEGLLTQAQYERMRQDVECDLRCTNIFLRIVLFLFTVIIVGAAVGILTLGGLRSSGGWIILAFFSYGAAELAVSQARLNRYGIEEAFAVCSVFLLCVGIYAAEPHASEFLVPAAGMIASLWIWHRFELFYAFPAALIFTVWLPDYWTTSASARLLSVAAIYAAGLIGVAAIRGRHRFTYLDGVYSIAEAFLWLGFYLRVNLVASPMRLSGFSWVGFGAPGISRTLYWITWGLIWLLPAAAITRGVRRKDRLVIAAGAIAATLTLITNKLYLGWTRHTWDPMLLGVLFIGTALLLRRWLAGGPHGVRHGFTAVRLSAKDKQWMDAGAVGIGILSPHSVAQGPQAAEPEFRFGGGDSGGGGASSEF